MHSPRLLPSWRSGTNWHWLEHGHRRQRAVTDFFHLALAIAARAQKFGILISGDNVVGFGAIATAIAIVSGIVTIIGSFLPIATKNARLIHARYIPVISILVGFRTFELLVCALGKHREQCN
jgi:hypothetical protein